MPNKIRPEILPASIMVMEVSPRDGLQNEKVLLPTEQKLELVEYAKLSGSRRIEVTSFVHPERVPQMADAEALCEQLDLTDGVRYTGLVLNERGYRRLRDTSLHEAGLVIPATDTFGQRNQGLRVADALAMAREVIADARRGAFPVQATIAVAFGCPFEGVVPQRTVLEIAEQLLEAGVVEIALADTIGVGVPVQVRAAFEGLAALSGEIPMRAHFHDTRNTAIGNAYAAIQAGVRILDASIGGIGGCPFAPQASGNVATEDVVYMLDRSGIQCGLDLDRLLEASEWLQGAIAKPIASTLLRAGPWPSIEAG